MTTPVIIALFTVALYLAAAGIGAAALGDWRARNRKEDATTHDDQIFRTAPRWAGRLNEKQDLILAGQRRLHQHFGFEADADYERDRIIMASIDDVIAKATEAKSVSESTNIAVREVIRLLKESTNDPTKMDEAVALLEAMRADDAAMLTENTPIDPSAE